MPDRRQGDRSEQCDKFENKKIVVSLKDIIFAGIIILIICLSIFIFNKTDVRGYNEGYYVGNTYVFEDDTTVEYTISEI